MIEPKRMITAGVTLTIAASVGYAMQNGDALASRLLTEPQEPPSVIGLSAQFSGLPVDAIIPALDPDPALRNSIRIAAATIQFETENLLDVETPKFLPQTCDLNMTALPQDGAMVRLNLSAPCYQNQRITVSHAGIEFADTTLADGTYNIDIPALNEYASFAVTFADGRSVEAKTLNLQLDGYQRVAVNWSGSAGLNIHALENGAAFGGVGHVWSLAPENSGIGRLIQLGNPDVYAPVLAQVYSVQTTGLPGNARVKFLVDAALTNATCGAEILGNAFQLSDDGMFSSNEIVLTLPACGGESGYLVLNNLFNDLRIAQN